MKWNPNERHQSIAGIKCLKEHCQITEISLDKVHSKRNPVHFQEGKDVSSACILVLIDYIFVYYTVGSITSLEQYRIETVENDW